MRPHKTRAPTIPPTSSPSQFGCLLLVFLLFKNLQKTTRTPKWEVLAVFFTSSKPSRGSCRTCDGSPTWRPSARPRRRPLRRQRSSASGRASTAWWDLFLAQKGTDKNPVGKRKKEQNLLFPGVFLSQNHAWQAFSLKKASLKAIRWGRKFATKDQRKHLESQGHGRMMGVMTPSSELQPPHVLLRTAKGIDADRICPGISFLRPVAPRRRPLPRHGMEESRLWKKPWKSISLKTMD